MYAIQASDADILIAIVAIVPGTLAALFAYLNGRRGKDVAAKLETGNGMGVGGYVVKLAEDLGGLSQRVDSHAQVLENHTKSDEENFASIHQMLTDAAIIREAVKKDLEHEQKAG